MKRKGRRERGRKGGTLFSYSPYTVMYMYMYMYRNMQQFLLSPSSTIPPPLSPPLSPYPHLHKSAVEGLGIDASLENIITVSQSHEYLLRAQHHLTQTKLSTTIKVVEYMYYTCTYIIIIKYMCIRYTCIIYGLCMWLATS